MRLSVGFLKFGDFKDASVVPHWDEKRKIEQFVKKGS